MEEEEYVEVRVLDYHSVSIPVAQWAHDVEMAVTYPDRDMVEDDIEAALSHGTYTVDSARHTRDLTRSGAGAIRQAVASSIEGEFYMAVIWAIHAHPTTFLAAGMSGILIKNMDQAVIFLNNGSLETEEGRPKIVLQVDVGGLRRRLMARAPSTTSAKNMLNDLRVKCSLYGFVAGIAIFGVVKFLV